MSKKSSTFGIGPLRRGFSISSYAGMCHLTILLHTSSDSERTATHTICRQRSTLLDKWSWRTTVHLSVALGINRLLQRWNQTGQKHAGSPDIVSSLLLPRPGVLWALVVATYLALQFRLSRLFSIDRAKLGGADLLGISAATALCGMALVFKMCFTARDAPELITGVLTANREFFEQAPLVALARIVFCGCGVGVVRLVSREVFGSKREERSKWHMQTL